MSFIFNPTGHQEPGFLGDVINSENVIIGYNMGLVALIYHEYPFYSSVFIDIIKEKFS